MRGNWMVLVVSLVAVVFLALIGCAPAPEKPVAEAVRLGALQDLTGGTSDVGKDEALGVLEATAYWNDQGGIAGHPITLFQYDYGYRVPEAVTTYKRFRDYDKVIAVLGWGTGDTEALSPTINKDKIVFLSSSFSGHLCDPAKTPYNFVYGSDYSTNARAALQYWYDNYWMKDPRYKADREAGKKPRLVAFRAFGVPYATAPMAALDEHAALLGFERMKDQDVSLFALDTKSQVLAVKEPYPHLVWHGNTTMSVSTALKDFYALGLSGPGKPTMHIINNWGFDENLPKLAGPAAEETIAPSACAYFVWDYPWKSKVVEYCQKVSPGVPLDARLIRTVQGWLKVTIMVEGLKAMAADGKLDLRPEALASTRALVKDYLEKASPITAAENLGVPARVYTPTDHRPTPKVLIAQIEGGKIVNRGLVDMKARYPDLWPKWLGY